MKSAVLVEGNGICSWPTRGGQGF